MKTRFDMSVQCIPYICIAHLSGKIMQLNKYANIRITKYENFRITEYENIWITKYQNKPNMQYQNIQTSEYANIRICKYQNMQTSEYPNIRKHADIRVRVSVTHMIQSTVHTWFNQEEIYKLFGFCYLRR